jgi:2-oxoglutarate/2-oxoacid ferredoxin oxidoreductase subunit beta
VGEENLLVHDEQRESPSLAFGLSRLAHGPTGPLPIGIFRNIERSVYDALMSEQLEDAKAKREGHLHALLHAGDTWQID